ncbi:alpha/beta-Hydrolase [Glarea lozoyensis ATCC 20868]|uniref:Alpha/beta-Hydrolase n=1 Tax=Glarea lozoyensis (strain ATCC 20868 / MF5171) TaxID=1116229 RepID=S3DIH1_GLAL2|nr:alpha/beta-Hydrolase [Glarea lozoyensis ATCC 20868]EPE36959.1 alpha/beta-Hydrolase [Glarea lozoyensis ATCC 20868]
MSTQETEHTLMTISAEYVALVGSFLFVGLEAFIRILTLALHISTAVRNASDFVEICALYGYYAEEHVVRTGDGYLLGLHRLAWRKGEESQRVNNGPDSVKKSVVYLHHGLLMNSEVWVCLTDEERCLPFKLLEKGYDVWLGNNRGNKYSKKSVHHSPTDIPFWNFSMDEFALHDIPDSISYILEATGMPSLSYIGFSQGTAQAFATLAVHPKLNDQVNVFIALAPAMSPAGLSNGIVDALVKASPQVLFLLFGRRSILSSATMWQSILYPPIFVRAIDIGLDFLFGWKARNISMSQKLAAYPHLYSFTSTKSVVHWFQIIRTKSFQMYDDDVQPVVSLGSVSKYTKVAKFPTRNIKTPIVLVYGGSDSLVDIKVMKRELPAHTIATEIPHYEHLDFLWAREVDTLVFPHVFDALDSFVDAEHSQEEYNNYHSARHASMNAGAQMKSLTYMSEDESNQANTYAEVASATPSNGIISMRSPQHSSSSASARKRARMSTSEYDSGESSPNSPATPTRASRDSEHGNWNGNGNLTRKMRQARSGSIGSQISFQEKNGRGISIGASKAVSGVVSGVGLGGMTGAKGSGDESVGKSKSKSKSKSKKEK